MEPCYLRTPARCSAQRAAPSSAPCCAFQVARMLVNMHNQVAAGDFSYVEQMRAAQAQAQVRGEGWDGNTFGAAAGSAGAACKVPACFAGEPAERPALPLPHTCSLQAQQAAAASQRVANGEPGADEDSSSDEEGSEDEEDGDAMDAEVGRAVGLRPCVPLCACRRLPGLHRGAWQHAAAIRALPYRAFPPSAARPV